MSNQPPLNPDALEADSLVSEHERIEAVETPERDYPAYGSVTVRLHHSKRMSTNVQLSRRTARSLRDQLNELLAVDQPVAQKLTDAEWQAFQAIPDQGYSHRAWVDARIAERVASAQPEVNSVEELDQLPGGSIVKSGGREFYKTSYVELPWILPYGVDRFGSSYLAKHSKVTVIHRPEVKP